MSKRPKRKDRAPKPVSNPAPAKRNRKIDRDKAPAIEIPFDDYNEQILIGAAMNDSDAARIILRNCKPASFMGDGHSVIVEAIALAYTRGLETNTATIRQLGGSQIKASYLDDIARQHTKVPKRLQHHIDMLAWDTARAMCVDGPISEFLGALKDPTVDRQRVQALSRMIPMSLEGYGNRQYMHDSKQLARQHAAEMRKRMGGRACHDYHIPDLDYEDTDTGRRRMVPGPAPKQITLVTAVSGSGKSTVLIRMALGFYAEKRRTLFGAWEMDSGHSLELLATFSLGLSRHDMAVGNFNEELLTKHQQRMEEIGQYIKFWKFPWGRGRGTRPKTNDEVIDTIHSSIADSAAEVVIFDLLRRAFVNRKIDAEEAALERMQVVCDETHTHHIYAQQQRLKDIEKRDDKHPSREGIKGTSVWVDVPDTIIGVHLPALWKPVPNDKLELLVMKQRHGRWPQRIEFEWDPEKATLKNGREVNAQSNPDKLKDYLG